MAGRIPQNFIDDLLTRTDIVDIINSRVPLKKKGREYTACCPFHNEKTPSFTVSESKQFYHCFGCGAHGTALGFIMEYDRLDFIDAVEALAAEYHLEVPRENFDGVVAVKKDEKQSYFDLLAEVSSLFQKELKSSDKAIQYLKNRGLTGEIAARYKIGYAPDMWDYLTRPSSDERVKKLVETGLIVDKEDGKRYDRFRDRIIFPIHDIRGRTIGFGGRVIDQGEPKYLNSPENVIFHKGLELYGLYEAKHADNKLDRIIIVEGYMDVVALAQHGINNVVAALGTATTVDQIKKSLRSTKEIVFCYDGDTAGRKAAWRALENALSVIKDGHIIRFLFLPDGEDPDTLVRKEGRDGFEERLESATPLSDFIFDTLKQRSDIRSEDGKAQYANAAIPLVSKLGDSILKDILYQRLSEIVGISVERLQKRVTTQDEPEIKSTPKSFNKSRKIKQTAIRTAIALLIQYPEVSKVVAIPTEFESCDLEGYSLLYRLHQIANEIEHPRPDMILERFRDSDQEPILSKLMEWDIPGVEDKTQREAVYRDAVNKMEQARSKPNVEKRLLELEEKSKTGLTDDEKMEYNRLLSG